MRDVKLGRGGGSKISCVPPSQGTLTSNERCIITKDDYDDNDDNDDDENYVKDDDNDDENDDDDDDIRKNY